MSWYVRRLLLDRDVIRKSIRTNYGTPEDGSYDISTDDLDWIDNVAYQVFNLDSDAYNDLLMVEGKLRDLAISGLLSKDEVMVLNYILSGKNIAHIERVEGYSRPTISKRFYDVCSRVAFHLGGIFTDDGYLNYMADKYKLNTEQVSKLKNIMSEEK